MAIPFAPSLTPQTAHKAPSRRVAGKIGRSLRCPPWPRRPSYDLRCAPCAAPERWPSECGQRRQTQARDREQWRSYGSLHCAVTLAQRCASHPDFTSNALHGGLNQRFHKHIRHKLRQHFYLRPHLSLFANFGQEKTNESAQNFGCLGVSYGSYEA